jgi:putative membrane protein
MKIIGQIITVALGAFIFGCSKDNNNDVNQVNTTDRNFVVQASYSNKDEIAAGAIASTKGMRDSIMMFGQMMVADHTKAQTSLDSIAGALGIVTPVGPDSVHLVIGQQLMAASGHSFDTMYIHGQVIDHQKTINLFQDEISNGNNRLIKDFANKNLPVIKMHYAMATSISSSE